MKATNQHNQPNSSRRRPVILLVDDDPDYRMLVRDALESLERDFEIYECVDGLDGLHFIQRNGHYSDVPTPTLVLLDLEMPRCNGHEVLKRLRADRRFKSLPVVVLTSLDDDDEEREAMRNGASSYTCKTGDLDAMWNKIETAASYWLGVHRVLPPQTVAA